MLKLQIYPAPVLSQPTALVTQFDDDLRALADEMIELMFLEKGIGLAAPQVGKSIRLLVFNVEFDDPQPRALVNPKIVRHSREKETDEEGCLSFPDIRARISRYQNITISAQDLTGNPLIVEASDLLARVLQHEIDHLDNIFFVNRASFAARLSLRSALKELEADAAK